MLRVNYYYLCIKIPYFQVASQLIKAQGASDMFKGQFSYINRESAEAVLGGVL